MRTSTSPCSHARPWLRWASLGVCCSALASLLVPAVQAETIYSYTNSRGDTVFTDQPTKGARKIHVEPPPPIPLTPIDLPPAAPPRPASTTVAPAAESPASSVPSQPLVPSMLMHPPEESPAPASAPTPPPAPVMAAPKASMSGHGHYQSLEITEPRSGMVKAHPGGTIFVQVKLAPALDVSVGDRIRIVIDGEDKVEDSTGHRFMISGLSEGEHTLIALVTRQGKNIFQSRPVAIHLTGVTG